MSKKSKIRSLRKEVKRREAKVSVQRGKLKKAKKALKKAA